MSHYSRTTIDVPAGFARAFILPELEFPVAIGAPDNVRCADFKFWSPETINA